MEDLESIEFKGAPMAKGTTVTITKMPINKIKLNKNSRLNIDPEELDGLMQSIKSEGLLQPIGVIKNGSGYEICYGNRRFLACSKLGVTTIPCIVHEKKKESDVDIKNLTENVQRRNISLAEVGRYIELLEGEGLSKQESAVRLGVSIGYVEGALSAFREVPKEFRSDIEVNVSRKHKGGRTAPGKISMSSARKIVSAVKSGILSNSQAKKLYVAAKESSDFNPSNLPKYIKTIAGGENNFLAKGAVRLVSIRVPMSERHYEELKKEHVDNGPFKTVGGFLVAVLSGEKSARIKVLKGY